MAELTPIERVQRTFDREPVDQMPFFTGMGMVLSPPIKERGWPFPKVHLEAEKLAWSGIDSARYANLDSIVIPYDMCWESEALGNTISLYEDSEEILYPTIPHKNWEEVEQVEITDDDIQNVMKRCETKCFVTDSCDPSAVAQKLLNRVTGFPCLMNREEQL